MNRLKYLSELLCSKGEFPFYKSQVIMLQALTVFTADRFDPGCGFESMDELREAINEYLEMLYKDKKTYDHIKLHTTVVQLLTNNYMSPKVNAIHGQESYLSNGIDLCLKSNVSRVINGNRPLPLYWRKAYLKSRSNISIMYEKLAWILQYLEVYYYGTERFAVKRKEPARYGGYISYYEIETHTAQKLYSALNRLCENNNIGFNPGRIIDFYDLAEVLLNVLISSYENSISGYAIEVPVKISKGYEKRHDTSMEKDFVGYYTVTFQYEFFDNHDYAIDNCIFQDRA